MGVATTLTTELIKTMGHAELLFAMNGVTISWLSLFILGLNHRLLIQLTESTTTRIMNLITCGGPLLTSNTETVETPSWSLITMKRYA